MSAKNLNKKNEEKRKLGVIGTPHTGYFPWNTTMSFVSMKYPENTIVKYHSIGSSLIYDARESIVKYAEKENADWILFVDSDMVFQHDALVKMESTVLNNEKPEIISGMCFKRTHPFQPCFYTKARINPETKKPHLESPIDFPNEGLIQCEGVGMAFCFIRMSAIKKMKEKIKDPLFFPFPGVGEDLSFCIRARMAGVNIFTDLSLNIGHASMTTIYKEHFFMARDEHAKQVKEGKINEPLFKEVIS